MATTENYALPLPADSLLVMAAPGIIRESNTAVDAALTEHGQRVESAERAATESAGAARDAAALVNAPADPVVAALLTGTGATGATALANKSTPFIGPLKTWRAALLNQHARGVAIVNTGSSTANGGNVTAENRRWFHRLAAAFGPLPVAGLGTARPAAGVQLYNTAVGGTSSANYLPTDKQNAILALNPDLILHMVGSNDWANGTTPATYKANVRARVVQFLNGTGALQVLIHQQPRFDVAKPAHPWRAYGAALAEIAAEFPARVMFLDLSERFEAMGNAANPYSLWDTDRIHLKDDGNRIIADLIGEFLGAPPCYLPRTLIPFTGALAGGSITANRLLAEVRVPARPYIQQVVLHASLFAGADSGTPDIELAALNPQGAFVGLRAIRVGPARANYSGHLIHEVPPHNEFAFHVRANVPGGSSLYSTSSAAYSNIYVDVSPL